MNIRTIISDTQIMFAEGLLSSFKEFKDPSVKVVGITYSRAELMGMMDHNFDVLIINPLVFSIEDFKWVSDIKALKSNIKVILITEIDNSNIVRTAFLAGIDGYILKSNQTIELHMCIDRVMEGQTFISEGLHISPAYVKSNTAVASTLKYEERFVYKQKLTKREKEILGLIVQCKNNKDIARELYISDQTASVHRKSIMKKFGVNSTNALIKFTIENQII